MSLPDCYTSMLSSTGPCLINTNLNGICCLIDSLKRRQIKVCVCERESEREREREFVCVYLIERERQE